MENISATGRVRRPANRKLLTEENVQSLPYKLHQYQVWDGTNGRGSEHCARGLSVMVFPSGTKSYRSTYYFSNSSKPHSRHLGRVGEMTLAEAREQCRLDRRNAQNGIDPKGDQTKSDAYAALVEEYVRRVLIGAKGNLSHAETKRMLLKDGKEWEHRSIATITAPEIQKLLEQLRDGDKEQGIRGRPYLANKLYGALVTFFAWCAKPTIGKLKYSPMTGIDKPWHGEKRRERAWFKGTAADDLIRKLWNAADQFGGAEGAYLKVLVLLAKRKTSLAEMRWEQIDDTWFWHMPQPKKANSTKHYHEVPLPSLVQRILHPRKESRIAFARRLACPISSSTGSATSSKPSSLSSRYPIISPTCCSIMPLRVVLAKSTTITTTAMRCWRRWRSGQAMSSD